MGPPAKRRKTGGSIVEEITWDSTARQDYLTGFHKRKQQRIQNAQKVAVEKERQQRIEDRKQLREQRKKEVEEHVQEVNAAVKKAEKGFIDSDDEAGIAEDPREDDWAGIKGDDGKEQEDGHEDEYIDEDKYTTVTVEPMTNEDDSDVVDDEGSDNPAGTTHPSKASGTNRDTKPTSKAGSKLGKPKKKRQKFRYESKSERKESRMRDKAKKSKAAQARRARD